MNNNGNVFLLLIKSKPKEKNKFDEIIMMHDNKKLKVVNYHFKD